MAGGALMLPPHGPPGPETHAQALFALDELSHVDPKGQAPPQLPAASLPQGATHNSPGPPQQEVPSALRQIQTCSQTPWSQ
jgi:hypothetical protein